MKISVILTSYNHEKYIRQSIESVLNQTYRNFEFIIADDCSTDSSWNIICEYQEKYPSIITIRHDYNWHGGTVEDIVKNVATGDYIALHHSDDVWELDKLEKQVSAMNEHPECVAIFTNARAIAEDGSLYQDRAGFYYNLFQTKNRSRQEWLNYFFYKGNCLCHPSILVKKDVYAADGFFRKGLRQIPDFVKWIQICKKYEIYVLAEPLVNFRIHANGGNASGLRTDTQIRSTIELFLMLDEYAQIGDRDEFIKIFPEAKEFCREQAFFPEYAFGRVCMQEDLQPYVRLYGMQQIYHVLNVPKKAEIIKKQYGYSMQNFMDATGKQDVFGLLPSAAEQVRTLYWNTGQGYTGEQTYQEKFFLDDQSRFVMKYELEAKENEEIVSLRFDPAEGIMCRCRIDSVKVNEQEVPCWAENAALEERGSQFFAIEDPIYYIEYSAKFENNARILIEISGEIQRVSQEEVSNIIMSRMYKKQPLIGEVVQTRSLYIDCGNGYSKENCITKKYYLDEVTEFSMECDVATDPGNKLVGLRFDPAEGILCKVKINRVLINESETGCMAANAYCTHDSWNIFLTTDPIYTIVVPEKLLDGSNTHIRIEGEIMSCTQQEVSDCVLRVEEIKKKLETQYRTLYWNTGQGYTGEQTYQEKFFLDDQSRFVMKYELEAKENEEIVSLRFDPAEGIMCRCRIDSVKVNEQEVPCWAENAALEERGSQFFAIEDPIYYIEYSAKFENNARILIEISGEIQKVSQEEVSNIIMNRMYKKQPLIGEVVQTRSLYINLGNGYSEENCITKKYYLDEVTEFSMECDVATDSENKLVGLRFDPAEGILCKVKINRVLIDEAETECVADNAYCTRDNWNIFLTTDPIYTIVIPEGLLDECNMHVRIEGEIMPCTQQEISDSVLQTKKMEEERKPKIMEE